MATLTITSPSVNSAVSLGAVAAGTSDQFLNDGRILLYVKNTNASSRTITVVTGGVVAGSIAIADVTFSVAQNEEKVIGPFPPRYFNNGNGYVVVSYSATAGVTVAAIKLT